MSRIFAFVFASLLIFPAVTPAQTAATGKPEDQIRQLEKDRFAAMIKVDEAAMNRLIGDDVAYVHSTAMLQNKKVEMRSRSIWRRRNVEMSAGLFLSGGPLLKNCMAEA